MRSNIRLKISNDDEFNEKNIYKIINKLIKLNDHEIDEMIRLLGSFNELFIKMEKLDISILIKQNFHLFLINVLKQRVNEIVLRNVLTCLIYWFEKYQENFSIFLTNEITELLVSIITDDLEANYISRILSIQLLQRLCYLSSHIVKFLLDNLIINKYMIIYKSECDIPLKNEILKNLYIILHTEPHPDFKQISQLSDLFIGMLNDLDDPLLQYLLTVSSAFIECGFPCAFIFIEIISIDLLFQQFSKLSCDSQISILYIFMRIFESTEIEAVNMLIKKFKWNMILQPIYEENKDSLYYQFSRMLCSAFARSPTLIFSAINENVFQFLFLMLENTNYCSMRYSMIALLRAFRFGFQFSGNMLIKMGIFDKMISFLETGSIIIIRETLESLKVYLMHSISENHKEISDILSIINYDEYIQDCNSKDPSKSLIIDDLMSVLSILQRHHQIN